eukprot:5478486-Amphidinium_carterae.1
MKTRRIPKSAHPGIPAPFTTALKCPKTIRRIDHSSPHCPRTARKPTPRVGHGVGLGLERKEEAWDWVGSQTSNPPEGFYFQSLH